MTYRVIKRFIDLQDKNYAYNEGDAFPRDGVTVSQDRIDELSGNENKRGVPLIEEVKEPEAAEPKKEVKRTAARKTAKKASE